MLTGGTDVLYRNLLATNPSPIHRIEVWASGARIDGYGAQGVPILGGFVEATLSSRVTRTLTLEIDEALAPVTMADLLAPNGNEIRITAGVSGIGGPDYTWPVFRGRIDDTEMLSEGRVTVLCVDRAADIADNSFQVPRNSTAGDVVIQEFHKIIIQSLSDATFGTSDEYSESVPELVWDDSRAKALEDLAGGANSFWYALADGSFVMRRIPWTQDGAPVVTLSDREGGTISKWIRKLTRKGVQNVITVVGERADGEAPVYATATDDRPLSMTFVGGKFGVHGKLVKEQAATTNGQAFAIARARLQRSTALSENWVTDLIPDASLELGDVAILNVGGRQYTQVCASITYPLGNGQMSVSWRGQVPVGPEN